MSQKNDFEYDASGFLNVSKTISLVPELKAKDEDECSELLKVYPDLVSEESLATQSPLIRKHVLSSCKAALEAWKTIQVKKRALSRLTPSDDRDSKLPNCLKNLKIGLNGSDNIVDDSRHIDLKAQLDGLVDEFKSAVTNVYIENAKLEVTKAMENLKMIIFRLCRELAKGAVRYVLEMNNLETTTEIEVLADQTTTRMIKRFLSTEEQYLEFFGYESKVEWEDDLKRLMFNGKVLPHENASTEQHDRAIVRECALAACDIVADNAMSLLLRKQEEHRTSEIMKRFQLETVVKEQQKANNDVKALLKTREGEENQVQSDLINSIVDRKLDPLKRENDQLNAKIKTLQRQLTKEKRSKSLGGGKDQSLNAKKNGPGSNGKQQKHVKFNMEQQAKRTNKKPGNKAGASQQGSGKGGGGKGSRRA